MEEPKRIRDADAAAQLFASIEREPVEVAMFAYLGAGQELLGMRCTRSPSRDTLDLPIREVARDALAFGATGVVMAHNHPGGDPDPSEADRNATRRLARALDPLGIRLLDHLVVTRDGAVSFRELGLL
ncbi:JAB domain-containing protein [Sphingomonas sp. AOB5]|uniref:JAB domain-containing protein n=1 Tax=Sphingomonas sp. AOB5 TaxID=3034017 RepID=UPI0023F82E0B|nr:JAB domain-containing protein [Sphingomonas sp. AOB5]MDF7776841.1 JAB domain-containing protein [Sphingomonas sp. AOB5]